MTPSTSTHADAIAAHHALEAAAGKVAEAELARDRARDQLDAALAANGWRRAAGAFSPDSALYSRLGGNLVPLADVLADLERTAA